MNVGLLGSFVLKAGLIGELVVNDPDAFKKIFLVAMKNHEAPMTNVWLLGCLGRVSEIS